MAELQPQQLQETLINGVAAPHPPPPTFPATTATTSTENNISSKRQRRPSVRLGEIGDQPAATVSLESSYRRAKQWKAAAALRDNKASKTRVLTNLGGGGSETLDVGVERDDRELHLDNLAIGSWRTSKDLKSSNKRVKRPRTNWLPNVDVGGGIGDVNNGASNDHGDGDDGVGEEGDRKDGFARVFEVEDSESPFKEQSQGNDSLEDDDVERGGGLGNDKELNFSRSHNLIRGSSRAAAKGSRYQNESHHRLDGGESDGRSDTEKNNAGQSGRGRGWRREDGVRIWLNGLGLGRYWPVFEIHEVDDEVLPMLTLEDLKDMGITAVGSRRKMFSAIQKLGKGFS
ncbi:hypothetical protein Drorol1_Dr00012578 [Drosera rotundifolia]